MDLIIYKFMSADGHFAYVLANHQSAAENTMKAATSLDVKVIDRRNANEFPYILDKMKHKSGIYLSYILPF